MSQLFNRKTSNPGMDHWDAHAISLVGSGYVFSLSKFSVVVGVVTVINTKIVQNDEKKRVKCGVDTLVIGFLNAKRKH